MSNGGEATFGREKVESSPFESWFERDGLATATRRERERIEGDKEQRGREREERERTRERNGGTRGVCRGTERRNVDEDRTRYGDERGPGGQWVSGPGPLNS